jgi:hypothetical protein
MKYTMSNIIFAMAPALFQIGTFARRCYFECAGSKAIEISLKPSRRL